MDEKRQEANLLSVLSQNYEALYLVDFDLDTIKPYRMSPIIEEKFGDYFRTNPSYEDAMTGYVKAVVAKEDQEDMLIHSKAEYIMDKLKDKRVYAFDYRVLRDGKILYYRMKISKLDDSEDVHHVVAGFADVTSEMERINQLMESQAMLKILEKDELTELYSKEFFFKEVIRYREAHPQQELIIWVSDIQGLKIINEKYGMAMGDEIIRILAKGSDHIPGYIFGGRLEGDKLVALTLDETPNLSLLNKSLAKAAETAFPIPNIVIKHGLYHVNPDNNISIQAMCDRAVVALEKVKDKFGINIAEYDDSIRKELLIHRQIMECAEDALKSGQFKVYFQPKIDTNTGKVGGAEALVRWIHPELGFMNPGIFIPLFEKNGFITNLDFYIWEEVCKALVEWEKLSIPRVPISVNVSRRDFEYPNLAKKIIKLVDKYNLPHDLFQIEITESSYSDNPDVITNTIKNLHDSDFSIALDDFGTGYSSMTALSSLDLDIMKLDMSIIQNDVPGTDKNILEFSMQLAKMMKLKTVAEGVETDAQAKRVASLGGDYIQGYYYSKPLPKSEYEEYMKKIG